MPRFFSACICALLLPASQAEARTEYQLGGVDGNPWQAGLSLEDAGVYQVFDENGQLERSVPVIPTSLEIGADTLIDFSTTSILPRFIDPTVNMALSDQDPGNIDIPLPYTGGQGQSTDGCAVVGQERPIIKRMLDGDPKTAQFRRFFQFPDAPPGIGNLWPSAAVLDFGAAVPINRIRFYPRLGTEDDLALIEDITELGGDISDFAQDSFAENFVEWYDIRVGDNSLPFRSSPCALIGGERFVRTNDPWLSILESTRENLDVVVDLQFPTQSIRWMQFKAFPLRDYEIAEFEVYGEGYVEETVYITQILDFGRPINWGKIRWSGETAEDTRIEIRTRTGATPDPNLYFAENINGDIIPATKAEYDKITVTARLPTVYDTDNWSFWSPPYDFNSGLRDPDQPATAWNDGTPLLSPGPNQYIQIAIRFFGTFTTAPRLDQLSLQFSESPSAQDIVGEIWPIEVDSFEPTTFTYVVKPTLTQEDNGFDRLEILTHTRATAVRQVSLDGEALELADFAPEIQEDRIVLSFPQLVGESDSFKQLEVVFDAAILRFGAEFTSWVFNSEDPDRIKQRVKPGNATFRFSANALGVKAPVGGDLLVDVQIPAVFTPNGDGVNDLLDISYKLREVTVDRAVSVLIFDLTGNIVAELPTEKVRSGQFQRQWDGRDANGQLLPPGVYLYKISLELIDNKDKLGLFALVY